MRAVRLEEARRYRHAEFGGERLHRQHRGVLARRPGAGEQALVLDAAEIRPLEQFRGQDHLRAPGGGLAPQLGDMGDVGGFVAGEGELQRGDCDCGHDCADRGFG